MQGTSAAVAAAILGVVAIAAYRLPWRSDENPAKGGTPLTLGTLGAVLASDEMTKEQLSYEIHWWKKLRQQFQRIGDAANADRCVKEVDRLTHEARRRATLSAGLLRNWRRPVVIAACFWLVRIVTATLGETLADHLSVTLHAGFTASAATLLCVFSATVVRQVSAPQPRALQYWGVILSMTVAGTAVADLLNQAACLGYGESALLLSACLGMLLRVHPVQERQNPNRTGTKVSFWFSLLVMTALGTTIGDGLTDHLGMGYEGSVLIVGGALVAVAFVGSTARLFSTWFFWLPFVLTQALGSALGDMLSKPEAAGGLQLGTATSSLLLFMVLVTLLIIAGSDRDNRGKLPPSAGMRAALG